MPTGRRGLIGVWDNRQAGPCMAWCLGAWFGDVLMMCGGGGGREKQMGLLPGLVRLDLIIGGGPDGVGEEVIGVVSGCEMGNFCVIIYFLCFTS